MGQMGPATMAGSKWRNRMQRRDRLGERWRAELAKALGDAQIPFCSECHFNKTRKGQRRRGFSIHSSEDGALASMEKPQIRKMMRKPTLGTLRLDDHLPDTVAILAGDCEGVIDPFDSLVCVSSGANHSACAWSSSRASCVSWFDRRTLKMVSSLRLIAEPSMGTEGDE